MHRFGLKTMAQAEEVMRGPIELWRGLKQLDVRGRRYVADWLIDRRKEEKAALDPVIDKHIAGQSKRRLRLIHETIRWMATKPWIRSATGYTRAYHVATDIEDLESVLQWFNNAVDVIDQHYGKNYFGLRLEWGFVHRRGEEVKALRVREWPGASGVILLDFLAATNQTLMRKPPLPMSEEDRAWRAAALRRVREASDALEKRVRQGLLQPQSVGPKPWPTRPDSPPEVEAKLSARQVQLNKEARSNGEPEPYSRTLEPESYGPEDWKLMADFLFMIRIPERDFEHQAKAYDGWWNKIGRKRVASQNIRSRIAPFS